MTIWNKVKDGLDKASKVAQDAVDEGKTRVDARRARQAADAAAQALGYAVYRAWQQGRPMDDATRDQLARAVAEREAEAVRLERAADEAAEWRRQGGEGPPPGAADGAADGAGADAAGAADGEVSGGASTSPHGGADAAPGTPGTPPPAGA